MKQEKKSPNFPFQLRNNPRFSSRFGILLCGRLSLILSVSLGLILSLSLSPRLLNPSLIASLRLLLNLNTLINLRLLLFPLLIQKLLHMLLCS